jgi:hypothetical protein
VAGRASGTGKRLVAGVGFCGAAVGDSAGPDTDGCGAGGCAGGIRSSSMHTSPWAGCGASSSALAGGWPRVWRRGGAGSCRALGVHLKRIRRRLVPTASSHCGAEGGERPASARVLRTEGKEKRKTQQAVYGCKKKTPHLAERVQCDGGANLDERLGMLLQSPKAIHEPLSSSKLETHLCMDAVP